MLNWFLAETKALPNRQKRRQNMRRKTKDLSEDVPSDSTSDQLGKFYVKYLSTLCLYFNTSFFLQIKK